MTGWRVGFLAAPARVIENALKAGQNSITCVAPFIQKAAAFALTDPAIQNVTANMRAAYARRRELSCSCHMNWNVRRCWSHRHREHSISSSISVR